MFWRKWSAPLFAIVLLLSACMPEGEKVKEELEQSLSKQQKIQSYSVEGSARIERPGPLNLESDPLTAALLKMLLQEEWSWEGNISTASNTFNGKLNVAGQSMPLHHKDSRTYFQFPFFDADQFYYIETTEEQFQGIATFDSSAIYEILQQAGPTSFQRIEEQGDDPSVLIRVDDPDDPVMKAFAALLEPYQPFLELPGKQESDYVAMTFTWNEEQYLVSEQFQWQAGEQTVTVTQQYSAWDKQKTAFDPPEEAIPLTVLLRKAEEIKEAEQVNAFDQFTPSVDFEETYPEGSEEAAIIDLLRAHLTALNNKDRDSFMGLFRSTGYASQHEDWFEKERKYQFIDVEDLSVRKINNQISVRVLHRYIDPDQNHPNLSGLVYTLYKNNEGNWTVQTIK